MNFVLYFIYKIFLKFYMLFGVISKANYKIKKRELKRKFGLKKTKERIYYKDNKVVNGEKLVSIIVPCYNHEPYLRERLDTIYGQTYKNFEVILLDDCSSDNSRSIMTEYQQKFPQNTTCYFNTENSGSVFRQWSKGIQIAKGDIIWIAESDDYCDANFLEILVPYFDKDDAVLMAYAYSSFINEAGEFSNIVNYLTDTEIDVSQPFVNTTAELVYKGFSYKNIIPNASSCLFRNVSNLPILKDEHWLNNKLCGDWIFYLEAAKGGKIAYSQKTKNYYRFHGDNTSSNTMKTTQYFTEHQKVFEYVVKNFKVNANALEKLENILINIWKNSFKSFSQTDFYNAFNNQYLTDILYRSQKHINNIVIISWAFSSGGGETMPIFLANQLRYEGVPITFACYNGQKKNDSVIRKLLDPAIAVVNYKGEPNEFFEELKNFMPEVIQTGYTNIDSFIAHNKNSMPFKFSHFVVSHGMYDTIRDEEIKYYITEEMKNSVDIWGYVADKNLIPFKKVGFDEDFIAQKFIKIPNGLPVYEINTIDRITLGIDKNSFVFCTVSRAVEGKGWLEAIEAIKLANKSSPRKIELILVGSGPVYEQLKTKTLPKFIHLTGFKSNVRDYISCADMGLLASTYAGESTPLMIIDSLLSNRPCLVSNIGDSTNMIHLSENELVGEVIEIKSNKIDIEELATKMQKLANEQELYNKLKSNAEKLAPKYSIEAVSQIYQSVYANLIQTRHSIK